MRRFQADKIPGRPSGDLKIPWTTSHIDIEIGAGAGLHAISYARSHPERLLIAIEKTLTKAQKLLHRTQTHDLNNLISIHDNAISWITHNVPAESIENYFLLYPNPYPKDKQRNQRWHAMPFMERLIYTLKQSGTITIATNKQDYFEECEKYLLQDWMLQEVESGALPQSSPARTHFEKKYMERGERCFQIKVSKP